MELKKICWVLLPLAIVALSGCDEVTQPLNGVTVNSSLPHTPPTFRDSSTSYKTYKILLEDVMGHFCGNCPPASQKADSLAQFNSHVIAMGVHSGFFADTANESGGPSIPPGLPAGAFSEDLTSIAGNYWQSGKLYNFGSWPQGLIDRNYWTQTSQNKIGISPDNWITVISSLISANPNPLVTINIHDSCWVPNRIVGMQITLNVLSALSDTYFLQTLIVEDSCFGWQLDDYTKPADISNYNHRFVLRSAVGNNQGTNYWGNLIPISVTKNGGTWTTWLTYDFTNGENGKAINWNMAHCYIVAFVYNQANYSIVQAEEIKVE